MNYYAVSALFNGLVALLVAVYVFIRNPKNVLNRSFLYFGVTVSGWSFFYSLWCWADSARLAFFYIKLYMTFSVFIYATLIHFILNFSNLFNRVRWGVYLCYSISLFYAITCHTGLLVLGVKPMLSFEYWPIPGLLFLSHITYACIIVSISLFIVICKISNSTGDDRRKAIWILLALIVGFGGGFVNWFLWFDILIPPVTNGFVGLHFLIMGYVIVRYRLMDVDVMVDILRANRNAHMGMMAASINHEIKSPLFVMQGLAQSYVSNLDEKMYANKEATEMALRELCHKIDREVLKIQTIIKQFSEFSKTDSITAQTSDGLDLSVVLRSVIEILKIHFYKAKVVYELDGPNVVLVKAEKQHVEEIFYNLLSNATQAMNGVSGVVSIAIKSKASLVEVVVTDNGPGIPKKQLTQIFEPFHTTKEEGTGLGLYITKQLVERNNGSIRVESEVGVGTKFILGFQTA